MARGLSLWPRYILLQSLGYHALDGECEPGAGEHFPDEIYLLTLSLILSLSIGLGLRAISTVGISTVSIV